MRTVILLLFAMVIPFPLCFFRMKKYNISLLRMLVIYLVFSTVGFIGARFGPSMLGIKDVGVKLYGLVLFDSVALFAMSKIMKIDFYKLGDFIAPPIMAVCGSAKINCMLNNCCKGFIMHYNGNEPVYFPSAIVEMVVWFVFVLVLLLVEKKKKTDGFLWPILMILFGVTRYLADFLRGSDWEKRAYILNMSGGKFWSLIIAIFGVVLVLNAYKRYKRRTAPKNSCSE